MKRTVRYFVENECNEVEETTERDFKEYVAGPYTIGYERHTVRENGVSQICLTAWST